MPPESNQLAIDKNALVVLLDHATSAARFVGYHDDLALGPLADDVDAIVHLLGEILSTPAPRPSAPAANATLSTDDPARCVAPPAGHPPEVSDIANAIDALNQLLARADALAHAAEDLYDGVVPTDGRGARRHRERLAHLIGNTAEAVTAALEATGQIAVQIIVRRARA